MARVYQENQDVLFGSGLRKEPSRTTVVVAAKLVTGAVPFRATYRVTDPAKDDMALPVGKRHHALLAIHSHQFTELEQRRTVGEREMHALHMALTRERHLIVGRPVFSRTWTTSTTSSVC